MIIKNKTFLKIPLIFIIIAVAVLTGGALVWGVIVSDYFSTTDNIADTWRVSVATSTGEITLETRSCDSDIWLCSASTTCANDLGDGDYIIVKLEDEADGYWKNASTDCDTPQCGQDGGQSDNMVADNTVTFGSTYPAREACKVAGGRLPTVAELTCIYTNRVTLGNNYLTSLYYYSAEERNSTTVEILTFVNGNQTYGGKSGNNYHTRCVMGW